LRNCQNHGDGEDALEMLGAAVAIVNAPEW